MFINDKQSTGRISRVVEITPLYPSYQMYIVLTFDSLFIVYKCICYNFMYN